MGIASCALDRNERTGKRFLGSEPSERYSVTKFTGRFTLPSLTSTTVSKVLYCLLRPLHSVAYTIRNFRPPGDCHPGADVLAALLTELRPLLAWIRNGFIKRGSTKGLGGHAAIHRFPRTVRCLLVCL